MTRVNVIPPSELSRQHLLAEYKEIMRLPGNLKQSLNRKGKPFSDKEIPEVYTLGKGHVKFFYNKMEFLRVRFNLLVNEMLSRGYNPTYKDDSIFVVVGFMGQYTPTEDAISINRQRIFERNNKIKGDNNNE